MTITHADPLFPDSFRKITGCPEVLYVLGNSDLLAPGRNAAVVGARKADEAGDDAAYRLGYMYAEQGYTVVSGLAFGCDAAAHRGLMPEGKPSPLSLLVLTGYSQKNIRLCRNRFLRMVASSFQSSRPG